MGKLEINRLVVRLFQSREFAYYFDPYQKDMKHATLYFDIWGLFQAHRSNASGDNEVTIISFLNSVFQKDSLLFQGFLTYCFNDFFNRYTAPRNFQEVLDELRKLGLVYKDGKVRPTFGTPESEEKIDSFLDEKLASLNRDFINMRKGTWDSLLSNNPDNIRQSISSARELFTQVIHKLTESEKFSESEIVDGKPTRRARLNKILTKNPLLKEEAEFIDKASDAIIGLQDIHSKGVHTNVKLFELGLFILTMTDNLLYFILSNL